MLPPPPPPLREAHWREPGNQAVPRSPHLHCGQGLRYHRRLGNPTTQWLRFFNNYIFNNNNIFNKSKHNSKHNVSIGKKWQKLNDISEKL